MPEYRNLILCLLIGLVLVLSACGGSASNTGEDTLVSAGEQLFAQDVIGSQVGCKTCHSLEPDRTIVGPSLAGVGERAGSRVAGLSAEEYIRQSILEPSAYVVDGFVQGTMPDVWEETLTGDQLDSLVAYLLSLK